MLGAGMELRAGSWSARSDSAAADTSRIGRPLSPWRTLGSPVGSFALSKSRCARSRRKRWRRKSPRRPRSIASHATEATSILPDGGFLYSPYFRTSQGNGTRWNAFADWRQAGIGYLCAPRGPSDRARVGAGRRGRPLRIGGRLGLVTLLSFAGERCA